MPYVLEHAFPGKSLVDLGLVLTTQEDVAIWGRLFRASAWIEGKAASLKDAIEGTGGRLRTAQHSMLLFWGVAANSREANLPFADFCNVVNSTCPKLDLPPSFETKDVVAAIDSLLRKGFGDVRRRRSTLGMRINPIIARSMLHFGDITTCIRYNRFRLPMNPQLKTTLTKVLWTVVFFAILLALLTSFWIPTFPVFVFVHMSFIVVGNALLSEHAMASVLSTEFAQTYTEPLENFIRDAARGHLK